MFRFFRVIRRQLVLQNRLYRYLLYAAGEIVLVVIGILLALQINSWNQERLERKEESIYLNRIINDLKSDLRSLNEARISHERRIVLGSAVLDALGKNNLATLRDRPSYELALRHTDEYADLLNATFGRQLFIILTINRFSQTDHAFREMLETGKMDLIQDDALKTAIQDQYLYTTDARSFQDEIVMQVQLGYRQALVVNGISTMNRDSIDAIIKSLTDQELLVVELENYLQISLSVLNDMFYPDDAIAKTTQQLIDKISTYVGLEDEVN